MGHTKPRCEKKFAALLTTEGIEHYLPLIETVRRYASKTERFQKPLFPGYVFIQSSNEVYGRLYQQDLLVRLLPIENQATFLRQLEQVRVIVASGLALALQPLLKRGARVRVTGGPLYGIEGVVDNPQNPGGIVVAIDVLRQGVHVRLPLELLQPLP